MRAGHNHYRTDGGPEPEGDDHDRMYPFCPMVSRNDEGTPNADVGPVLVTHTEDDHQ